MLSSMKLRDMTIRKKILLFNAIVLAITMISLVLLTTGTLQGSSEIELQQRSLVQQRIIQEANHSFAETRYWLFDLAVSWQNLSEESMENNAARLRELFEAIGEHHPEAARTLTEELGEYIEINMEAVDAYIDGNRVKGNSLVAQGRSMASSIQAALSELSSELSVEVEASGVRVVDTNALLIYGVVGTLILVLMVSIASALGLAKIITKPLSYAIGIANRIAEGDLDSEIVHNSRDESGQLLSALSTMQRDLRNRIETEKNDAEESLRIRQAVDKEIEEMVEAAAVGDFSKQIVLDNKDEFFKVLCGGLNSLVSTIEVALDDVLQMLDAMSRGNLTERITSDYEGSFGKLQKDANSTVSALAETLKQIADNANQVAAASSETSTAIGQISDGAQNQLLAMSQVVTAVTQSSQAASDVAKNTNQASTSAQEAVSLVIGGQKKVSQMVDVVNVIAQNSKKINKITDAISAIANQTNMLSLNAAIEAARAGEHGSGFAVVAEEVRKLAEHSASLAQEIAGLVEGAVREASNAKDTAAEVQADMTSILSASENIDEMLRRVATAMEQQSATVQEINSNVSSMKEVAENNASASEEITATVLEVSRQADAVRSQVNKFQFEGGEKDQAPLTVREEISEPYVVNS